MNNTDSADTPANGVNPLGSFSGLADAIRIPVIEEQVQIEKQLIEIGRLLINKAVREEERVVTTPLVHEELSVERVPVNKYVDVAPSVRYEGDVTIVSVVKEVVVVETRLVLVEEVHITKRQITTIDTQQVTLRQEEVTVERIDNKADVRSDSRSSL